MALTGPLATLINSMLCYPGEKLMQKPKVRIESSSNFWQGLHTSQSEMLWTCWNLQVPFHSFLGVYIIKDKENCRDIFSLPCIKSGEVILKISTLETQGLIHSFQMSSCSDLTPNIPKEILQTHLLLRLFCLSSPWQIRGWEIQSRWLQTACFSAVPGALIILCPECDGHLYSCWLLREKTWYGFHIMANRTKQIQLLRCTSVTT